MVMLLTNGMLEVLSRERSQIFEPFHDGCRELGLQQIQHFLRPLSLVSDPA